MANYETILVERRDNIATITFNRPRKRNAMNPKLHHEMVEVLTELRFDKDLRVLILTGAGESFSAGEDLKEFFYGQRAAEIGFVTFSVPRVSLMDEVNKLAANSRKRTPWLCAPAKMPTATVC
jgi:trans-feruloyl-CoA hydratase/vanillin synthase